MHGAPIYVSATPTFSSVVLNVIIFISGSNSAPFDDKFLANSLKRKIGKVSNMIFSLSIGKSTQISASGLTFAAYYFGPYLSAMGTLSQI